MTTRLHRELLKTPLARTGVGCAAVVLIAVAILTGYASWLRLSRARASANWTAVEGQVEKVGIEETWSNGQTQYIPRVSYRFAYDGKTCIGNRISPHDLSFGNRLKAEEAIVEYAPGEAVTVYCNPENPSDSLLRPGAERMDYLMLGLPLVFLLFAIGFMQMLSRARQAHQEESVEENEA